MKKIKKCILMVAIALIFTMDVNISKILAIAPEENTLMDIDKNMTTVVENEEQADAAKNERSIFKEINSRMDNLVSLPTEPTAKNIVCSGVNTVKVSTVFEFNSAYQNDNVACIELLNNLSFGSGAEALSPGYILRRDLKIDGKGYQILFDSYSAGDSILFELQGNVASTPKTIEFKNIKIDLPYTYILVAAQSYMGEGWSMVLDTVEIVGTWGGYENASGYPLWSASVNLFFRGKGEILGMARFIGPKHVVFEKTANWVIDRNLETSNYGIFDMSHAQARGGGDLFFFGQAKLSGGYYPPIWQFNALYVGSKC